MSMGFGFALPALRQNGFSPLSLFADGSQGVWYDDSLTSSMFQNSNGTTAAVLESPVGLQLDLSRNLTLGSNIVTPAANSTFTSDTGFWTKDAGVTISGGSANWTATAATYQLYKTGQLTVGKYYEATFTISSITSGGLRCNIGGNLGTVRTTAGTYTERLVATGSGTMAITSSGASTTASVTLVSFFEVTGTHRSQATSANRPTLSARYNLLTKTEDLTNAAWTKSNCTITSGATDPDGGATAFTATATANSGGFYQSQGGTFSGTYRSTIYIRRRTGTGTITLYSANGSTGNNITSTLTSSWSAFAATDTAASTNIYGPQIVLGTSGDAVDVWHPDIRSVNQATGLIPTYQRVDTSSVYDTVGFPQYIKYNGSNSSLSTASINFTATAQMSAFSGLRKLSESAYQCFVSSGTPSTENQRFAIFSSYNSAAKYAYQLSGSSFAFVGVAQTDATFTAPVTNVVSSLIAISVTPITSAITSRVNAAAQTLSAVTIYSTSPTTFANSPLVFGVRADSNFYFNGQEFQTIIVGKTLTATEISNTETYVNSKTKAY